MGVAARPVLHIYVAGRGVRITGTAECIHAGRKLGVAIGVKTKDAKGGEEYSTHHFEEPSIYSERGFFIEVLDQAFRPFSLEGFARVVAVDVCPFLLVAVQFLDLCGKWLTFFEERGERPR